MTDLPKVSIVIVNLNGRYLLPECFKSISKLNYPKDKLEVVVVDNGSSDGSVEYLKKKYKSTVLVQNAKNQGFAKPSNDGARAATGEYVAFLNNDMRVEKDWLVELVNSIRNENAQCAASLILSWNGDMLDFAGGSVNFYGLGYQYDFHVPLAEMNRSLSRDKEILFACGGAMLVDRRLFLDAGGFDEDYFAYFEDVDFGWRFTLLGNKTVLSVKSRVRHKHNGTSSRIAKERIRKLCERNKLYTIFKNYGDEIFNRVMLPAFMLDMHEAYKLSEIDADNYDIGSESDFDDTPVRINHMAALKYTAFDDLCRNAPKMWEKRRTIQARRKIPDSELLRFITDPFMVFPKDTADFINTEYDFIKSFRLDEAFSKEFKTKVLVVTGDKTRGERFDAMADALWQNGFEVTLCSPGGEKASKAAFVPYAGFEDEKLLEAAKAAQIIVVDVPAIGADKKMRLFAEATQGKYIIADLSGAQENTDLCALDGVLEMGDFVLCGSDSQKGNWQSLLAGAKKLSPDSYAFNKTGAEIFAAAPDGSVQAVVDFCKNPFHLAKEEIIVESGGEKGTVADSDDGGVPLNGALLRKIEELQKQQRSMAELLKKNTTIVTETERDVKDVLEQSNLMNSRFLKLKNSLSRFKIFSRFFK